MDWAKSRRLLQEDTRNIYALGFGATYTRGFMVILMAKFWEMLPANLNKYCVTITILFTITDIQKKSLLP